jgi:hypothetical protein
MERRQGQGKRWRSDEENGGAHQVLHFCGRSMGRRVMSEWGAFCTAYGSRYLEFMDKLGRFHSK